jgi:ribA/ribD-fused uncharacterized protein
MTDTHIYFWGSVLSNWHQGGNFKGSIALRWLVNKLESLKNDESTTIKVDIPPRNSRASQLILNHSFNCGEQFMMASKAWLFDRSPEATVLRSILASKKPVDQKALGRKVPGFNEKVWDMVSNRVVVASQLARAAVDPKLAIIYNTSGTRMFVEGSPYDNIWGVGVRWDDVTELLGTSSGSRPLPLHQFWNPRRTPQLSLAWFLRRNNWMTRFHMLQLRNSGRTPRTLLVQILKRNSSMSRAWTLRSWSLGGSPRSIVAKNPGSTKPRLQAKNPISKSFGRPP